LIMKGSTSLPRFGWLRVNFSHGWGSAGGQIPTGLRSWQNTG
jgi:hypothetical protein